MLYSSTAAAPASIDSMISSFRLMTGYQGIGDSESST